MNIHRSSLTFKMLAASMLIGSPPTASAQSVTPNKNEIVEAFGFEQRKLQLEGAEESVFYLKDCVRSDKSRLFLYLQGSDPGPQFSWKVHSGEAMPITVIPQDYRTLSIGDCYVVVEKAGMGAVFQEPVENIPQAYHDANSLDDRVTRASAVIDELVSEHAFNQVLVYGHSEGAPVAAKLATQNKHITHLGFWAGSVLGDFYDFTIQTRSSVHRGEVTSVAAQTSIDEALHHFDTEIVANGNDTRVDDFGYTNKRWMSFAEPALYHLLALDIPIFMQVATDDESAPIDSTYIVPLEFARLGKTNLTYRVCDGCDHGFRVASEDGTLVRKWPEIFGQFVAWSETADVRETKAE